MVDIETKENKLEVFSYKEIFIITSLLVGFWIAVNVLFN